MFGCNNGNSKETELNTTSDQSTEFYQLKTYTFDTENQLSTTENYIREAFLPGVKKLGINLVGVFKPRPSDVDTLKKLVLLIPFTSLSQYLNLEEELGKDAAYLEAGREYLNASFDEPQYSRIESILLKGFEAMPFIKAPELKGDRASRVYELRSYQSATEAYHLSKVDMFNNGGEIKLFEKLGFNALFYARVISGSKMPNLMYMITFDDEASQKAHWDAFMNSPEWTELKALPKYLNTVSHIDKTLLYPTEYSDY